MLRVGFENPKNAPRFLQSRRRQSNKIIDSIETTGSKFEFSAKSAFSRPIADAQKGQKVGRSKMGTFFFCSSLALNHAARNVRKIDGFFFECFDRQEWIWKRKKKWAWREYIYLHASGSLITVHCTHICTVLYVQIFKIIFNIFFLYCKPHEQEYYTFLLRRISKYTVPEWYVQCTGYTTTEYLRISFVITLDFFCHL